DGAEQQLESWQSDLEQWQQTAPSLGVVEARQNEVLNTRQKADECVTNFSSLVESLQQKIQALGEEKEDEAEDLKKRRKEMLRQQQLVESELAVCRLLTLGMRELQDGQKQVRNKVVSQALTHRDTPVWETLYALIRKPDFFAPGFAIKFSFWPSILAGLLVILIFMPIARYLSGRLSAHSLVSEDDGLPPAEMILAGMYAKRLIWIVILSGLSFFTYLGGLTIIGAVLLALVISMMIAPLLELLVCQNIKKCSAGFPARALLDIVLIGLVVHFSGLREWMTNDAFTVLRSSYYFLVMFFSLWLLFILSRRDNFQFLNSIRLPLAIAMISGPTAMLLGYKQFAQLLVPGIYGSLVGFLVVWVIYQAGGYLLNMFEPDGAQTNPKLREFLGYKESELIPGVWLGRLLLIISVGGILVYWLLFTWNIPHSEVNIIKAYFTEGFPVGAITIVPSKIIAAVLVFFLFLTLARWLRNEVALRWLSRTRLDAGARESIVSLTTYTVVGIALVIALGMAGVDFQNIAIVAGALSVGIGFGLQNIVNNFVSGLILLFERPVKPGDWIVVGTTEGYVKKINIRYTLIQTFDRADVLVPNSELISNQVTNWMHRDSIGRVIVPVGVAYGSDTQRVKDILLKIAIDHPMVLTHDYRVDAPQVRFMGFGESSLDFELRCFIENIDRRFSVRSDLLFSIDDEFRKADIEIPFPQRVVHMEE
ncbi:MAG: mechanosensitive ion channel, partial [Gammaproteobacteria bacterium]|nr:mechanosensitive ion channel [Gammaproteobacteria bacterium]